MIDSAAKAIRDQESRQDFLEELYRQDGRHDPEHRMHGLYTGLFVKHTHQKP